jgi:hypothetical protein
MQLKKAKEVLLDFILLKSPTCKISQFSHQSQLA